MKIKKKKDFMIFQQIKNFFFQHQQKFSIIEFQLRK